MEIEIPESKCFSCNGGYQSAAAQMGMEDMPIMLRPIGVWPCPICKGKGKFPAYKIEILDKD